MSVTLYHNPKCSKSRQTLGLIEERGVTPTIVKYLETPPTSMELKDILGKLNISPRELLRKKEDEYSDLKLDDSSLSDEDLIKAMVEHPVLIERPIVITENQARIGRPPEQVLEILE